VSDIVDTPPEDPLKIPLDTVRRAQWPPAGNAGWKAFQRATRVPSATVGGSARQILAPDMIVAGARLPGGSKSAV
jgi:hypothetical protein